MPSPKSVRVRRMAALAIGVLLCAALIPLIGGAARGAPAAAGSSATAATLESACVPTLAAGSQVVDLDVDGIEREVIVHVPTSAAGTTLPAVVAFHGYSAFASELEATSKLSALADSAGFVAAYPQGLGSPTEWHFAGNQGNDQRDLAMIRSLLTLLEEDACVDPDRIVLAGHSMGGAMASDAACRLADQVAGVVLVAALWFELPCPPSRPVPVVALHALDDPVLPYAGGPIGGIPSRIPEQLAVEAAIAAWAAHDGCGVTPGITRSEDGGALLTWPGCSAPVALHRLPSGGHDWPAVASDLIAEMATAE